MRLSDYKGDEALDVLADLIDPIAEIASDREVLDILAHGKKRLDAIKIMLKNHKRSVIQVLAALDREDPDTYKVSVLTLPLKLMELLNDPEVQSLFTSAEPTADATPSGSASESREE